MKRLTKEDFIKKSRDIHSDKYDYSLVDYIDKKTKVKIIYKDEIYEILPRYHLKYGVIINRSSE